MNLYNNLYSRQIMNQVQLKRGNDVVGNILQSTESIENIDNQTQDIDFDRIMDLEGECKIKNFQFLKLNCCKAVILTFFLTISIIGLFILKYSIKLRTYVFYDSCTADEATHLYVVDAHEGQENVSFQNSITQYQKLKYQYDKNKNKFIPVAFILQKYYKQFSSEKYQKNGLSGDVVVSRIDYFGLNQHLVDVPGFLQFMFDKLTGPFYILQYIFCISFILTGYATFGIALLAVIIILTNVNYFLIRASYLKIKDMAEKQVEVEVIREGKRQKIMNTQIVPGDIFIPHEQITCDALVLKGDAFVNQANLTGESYPIGKFPVTSFKSTYESYPWLYEGSRVLESSNSQTLAVAINTGFRTKRGKIIRRILTKNYDEPQIFKSALTFICQTTIVGVIAYICYLVFAQQFGISLQASFKAVMFFDFLSSYIPSTIAINFSLNYTFSLTRLSFKGIMGTTLSKTVEGARTKVICFDKTGTITQSDVTLKKIYNIQNSRIGTDIKDEVLKGKQYTIILDLLATCHTTRKINDEFEGDEIDKEIFLFSKHKLIQNKSPDAIITIESEEGKVLEVLKINQFESKFQSMSVLIRDTHSQKTFVFIKGAPQKIFKNSKNKPDQFHETVESLSLGGYRSIAIGFKEIFQGQVKMYLTEQRNVFEENVKILGILAFENKVKEEANETMERLKQSNIDTKIITGDNIYIAIETAIRCGILSETGKILVLEGKNQASFAEKQIFTGKVLQKTSTSVKSQQISLNQSQYENQQLPIAIDNDFLNLKPQPKLVGRILVFARIPPQNKALIVRIIKNQYIEEFQEKGLCYRLSKGDRLKVGMCGDGANDLLALRQADLSLGIRQSDASYASSFTLYYLLDVDEVIRESKNTVSNIMQFLMYVIAVNISTRMMTIIMVTNAAQHSPNGRLYYNFMGIITFPIFIILTRPNKNSTADVPVASFMTLYNHITVWGNAMILTATIAGAYVYFKTTDQFQKTTWTQITFESKAFQEGTDATVMFLIGNLLWTSSALGIYWGGPWKIKLYEHIPLIVLSAINIIVGTVFFFITDSLTSAFGFGSISVETGAVVYGIVVGGIVVQLIFNSIIYKLDLYKTTLQ